MHGQPHIRCTCYVAVGGSTVVNCGVETNVENVAVDHFFTILEEYEEYWVR